MGEAKIGIVVGAGPDVDDEELDQLSRQLRHELLTLDVDRIDRAAARPSPIGARSPGADLAETLILTVSNSAGVVALVAVLRDWVNRRRGRSISMRLGKDQIDVAEVAPDDQAKLIEAWIRAHDR